ncbi:low affinity iron transporter [Trichoderma arundinaceum]|uniref:Low affinity iron transporter n=1 Tax=Trichoderma arundinaceum TaxID=490622 RepID=A0A395NKE9_TRIAR|nr:low affinity iron transporter [Trichoderma arundinaceum]
MFKRIIVFLSSPGAKGAIEDAAPTQYILSNSVASEEGKAVLSNEQEQVTPTRNITGYVDRAKKDRLDRWLDRVVKASGSQPIFFIMISGLLIWAFLGIRYGQSDNWAAIISDVQAIISYFFDSLLMRQQLNGYERQVRISASLMSRVQSQKRMLRHVLASNRYKKPSFPEIESSQSDKFDLNLPPEDWISRVSNLIAMVLGHSGTICIYWICIFIWLGFGQYCNWSDRWQLYINSGTSALMILIFTFLANIRERHDEYVEKCMNSIFKVDSDVELKLRILSGDTQPNPIVVVPAPHLGTFQRIIFYYADVVGTLVGIALLVIVLIVWACIGPVMHWDNNWWLFIGTYAGLIGLIDGFVLRNVQHRLHQYERLALEETKLEDAGLSDEIGVPVPEKTKVDYSINYRLSDKMGFICAHELTVILGIMLVIGLVIGASAMRWTLTGQLICNIPPSIIESFFMMILITGHNISEAGWRANLHHMYLWRLRLFGFVDRLADEAGDRSDIQEH